MRRLLPIILFCIAVVSQLHGQPVSFNRISSAQGLSNFSVSSIYPDEQGEIWIATRMGLNCYSGNRVTTYVYHTDRPYSLFSNSVQRIVGDGHGHLYLQCTGGLARMDLRTRRFYTLINTDVGAINYQRGHLYVGLGNRLYAIEAKTAGGEGKGARWLVATLPGDAAITASFIDSHNRLWIGTTRLGAFCLQGRRLTHPVTEGRVSTFYEDRTKTLWIGTWTDGCYQIYPNGRTERHGLADGFGSDFFRTFCEDNDGMMWMGTANGLVRYDRHSGAKTIYRPDATPGCIADKSVWSIAKDRQGTLWIGTYFGGVNYMNPSYQIFQHYRASLADRGLTSNVVGRMTEDNDRRLWICTEGGGLNVLDLRTGRFGHAIAFPGNGEPTLNLKSIYFDAARHALWIGTHLGGLTRIDLTTFEKKNWQYEPGNPHGLPSNIVRDIIGYGPYLIVGTQQGLALFNPDTGRFTQLMAKEHIDYVSSIIIDRHDNLWVATEGKGAYRYNLKTRSMRHYVAAKSPHSIGSDNLNHLFTDSKGRLWIATSGNGILCYRPQTDDFEHYGERQRLVGNSVYSIAESSVNANTLLLITNKGFSTFDITQKQFNNYLAENGFPLSTANEQALYVTRGGLVCLGSVDGMFTFAERDLLKPMPAYRLFFSHLFVNGREVEPLDGTGILNEAMPYVSSLQLKNNQSDFSIEIASTNSIRSNGGELFYRLRGYQDEWTSVPVNQQMLSFVGLPAGSYTLELRSSARGVPVAKLHIRILPPWYASWRAYIIYVVIALILVRYFFISYKHRVQLREQLIYNRQRIKDIEQMNRSKIDFFTNISHEIRTPLTVITALAETLLHAEHFPASIYNKILSIYKNSTQLRALVTELLDFRKQEEGKLHIKVAEYDFTDFVQQSCLLYREYASGIGVKLVCNVPEHFTSCFDMQMMQKVINNLLSNALKHTPKGGTITVSATHTESEAVLRVVNTGEPIPVEEIRKIFDNFYQTEHLDILKPGTGLGLALTKGIVEAHHGVINVESAAETGTVFTVLLPLSIDAFKPEERATQKQQEADNMKMIPLDDAPESEEGNGKHTGEPTNVMLVVEDNEAIRQLLVELLSPYYKVVTAVDGKDGLSKAHEMMPDIIISDIVMPNMSGIELCRSIKHDFSVCHIPVVLLTARNDINSNLESLKIGADEYITKPFNSTLLISRCNNIINTRQMLRRKFSERPHDNVDLVANNPLDKRMMEQAMAIITKNYTNPEYSVNDFARDIGMSRTSLFTKWKQLTGDTPKSFILNMRLRKSAEMLREHPEMSIAAISERNGFTSAKYFCKCFKDCYKIQPSAYRKGNTGPQNDKDNDNEQ